MNSKLKKFKPAPLFDHYFHGVIKHLTINQGAAVMYEHGRELQRRPGLAGGQAGPWPCKPRLTWPIVRQRAEAEQVGCADLPVEQLG